MGGYTTLVHGELDFSFNIYILCGKDVFTKQKIPTFLLSVDENSPNNFRHLRFNWNILQCMKRTQNKTKMAQLRQVTILKQDFVSRFHFRNDQE